MIFYNFGTRAKSARVSKAFAMEKELLNEMLLDAAKLAGKLILFRNNTGLGWIGTIIKQTKKMLVLENPRPLHSGLHFGSTDLIGWTEVEITPQMVGKTVAVFTAIEGKFGTTTTKKHQKHFIEKVVNAGGIALVCRHENISDEVLKAVADYEN